MKNLRGGLPDHAAQSYTIAEVELVILEKGMPLHN